MRLLPKLAVLIALISAPALADRGTSDEEQIREIGKRWQALYQAGEFKKIPELYTLDTLVMPRGRPAVEGRSGMERAVGGLAAGRSIEIDLHERELVVHRPYAWMVNDFEITYTSKNAGTSETEFGRSLIIYRLDDDGTWRLHRDFDAPAPTPTGSIVSDREVMPVGGGWDGSDRSHVTECDRMASSRYDRMRLAPARARADIDVDAAIAQCEVDLSQYPDDPRLHFHLGRLYGYTGEADKSRFHREAAAAAGNHNAIFLLAYLDFIAAKDESMRCRAVSEVRRAAQLGNYSAQLFYTSVWQRDTINNCGGLAPADEIAAYLDAAKPQVDGFFETLLVNHLQAAMDE